MSVNTTVSLSWGVLSDERAGLSYVRSYRYCQLYMFTYLLFEWEWDKKPGSGGGGQWQELHLLLLLLLWRGTYIYYSEVSQAVLARRYDKCRLETMSSVWKRMGSRLLGVCRWVK